MPAGTKLSADNNCTEAGSLQLIADATAYKSDYVQWSTTAPSDMELVDALASSQNVLINPKASTAGFTVQFHWDGGAQAIHDTGNNCCGGMDYGSGLSRTFATATRWFDIQITCSEKTCEPVPGQVLDVNKIELEATDDTPPAITPLNSDTNIEAAAGQWVRGIWSASFTANSQAGVCQAYVAVNDALFAGESTAQTPLTGSWTQCGQGAGTLGGSGAQTVTATVDTTRYANGPLAIKYYAADAAQPANVAASSFAVKVDNTPVGLTLSGPTQATGPADVTAKATAGPSGVYGILCSVNGGQLTWYRSSGASIPVSATGLNTVSCVAQNNAINDYGQAGTSPTQTLTVDIRKPTVSLISMTHVADALRCVKQKKRIHLGASWITEHYHGHPILVKVPAQTRTITIEHCHPRIEKVRVRRNGRKVTERIVELPHKVSGWRENVSFGRRVQVNGWLGTPNGDALGGQTIVILTAPANGSGAFTPTATTRTNANGSWTVELRPGPSRLIEASYGGNTQMAPATSGRASVTVPASATIEVRPRRTQWGQTIVIQGQLRGGYIPASGELVVLRIGWSGGSAEIGHVYTNHQGAFRTTYTFLRGTGSETYRIWAQTIRESDYPYAPASSRRVTIVVAQ